MRAQRTSRIWREHVQASRGAYAAMAVAGPQETKQHSSTRLTQVQLYHTAGQFSVQLGPPTCVRITSSAAASTVAEASEQARSTALRRSLSRSAHQAEARSSSSSQTPCARPAKRECGVCAGRLISITRMNTRRRPNPAIQPSSAHTQENTDESVSASSPVQRMCRSASRLWASGAYRSCSRRMASATPVTTCHTALQVNNR